MRFVLYGAADPAVIQCLQDGHAVAALRAVCTGAGVPHGTPASALALLQQAGLVCEVGTGYTPGPTLVLPPAEVHERLSDLADVVAEDYVRILRAAQGDLRAAYEMSAAAQLQGIPWEQVCTLVLWGLTLDLGVGQVLVEQGLVKANLPDERIVWALRGEVGASFGVRTRHRVDQQVGVGELWVNRATVSLRLTEGEAMLMRSLRPGGAEAEAELAEPGARVSLRFAGVIRGEGEALRLAIPVVQAHEPLLTKTVPHVAANLVQAALRPALAAAPAWQGLSPTHCRLTLQRMAMERAAARLLDMGAVTGQSGLWCWFGPQHWVQVG